MRKILLIAILSSLSILLTAQKPAYLLFDQEGKETKYKKMLKACQNADVILFGELHNNPIAHWLQLELTLDVYAEKDSSLVLGAEMFEADGQLIMDEYFSDMISIKKFEEEMRLWNNYKTDYKPLLEFAKDSGLQFVATNIPRRYASMVFNLGLDTLQYLSDQAKEYMMPLPLEYDTSLECYASLAGGMGGPMGDHGNPNFRDAQAVKDATMTHFILENLEEGQTFIHYNGAYHSDNFESMHYFLKAAREELNIVTISTVSQSGMDELLEDNLGKAHFIICVPETMTTTY